MIGAAGTGVAMVERVKTDILVIGGNCGIRAAVEAARMGATVALVVKGRAGFSGATPLAGADFTIDGESACRMGYEANPEDTPEVFARDIITEGLFLNNQKLVKCYVEDAGEVVAEIIKYGMKVIEFQSAHGEKNPRGIITTGPQITGALRRQLKSVGSTVRLFENTMAVDLLLSKTGTRVAGALAVDLGTGAVMVFEAKSIVLATGGWHQLYPFTSGSIDLTGDAQGMAYRIGAELVDMEMVQFCPNIILDPPMWRGSLYLYWPLGEKVEFHLLNKKGERFLEKWDTNHLERSTKEIVSLASTYEVEDGNGSPNGGVYFSLKHIPQNIFEEVQRELGGWKKYGVDHSYLVDRLRNGYAIEVGAAAHFFIGGIRVDNRQETTVRGLYAAGECAGGLWGANRVAAATTQILVQGRVAGRCAAESALENDFCEIDEGEIRGLTSVITSVPRKESGLSPIALRKEVQQVAKRALYLVREGEALEEARQEAQRMRSERLGECALSSRWARCNREWQEYLELRNLIDVLEASSSSAACRKESRGAHYRSDYPNTDNDHWLKNVVVTFDRESDKARIRCEDVVPSVVHLPKGVLPYKEAIEVATSTLD